MPSFVATLFACSVRIMLNYKRVLSVIILGLKLYIRILTLPCMRIHIQCFQAFLNSSLLLLIKTIIDLTLLAISDEQNRMLISLLHC